MVSAAGVGFLASCGVTAVPVYRRPRVAIIPIGLELLTPKEPFRPGCIRDSNSYAMAACVAQTGGYSRSADDCPDKEECLARSVKLAAEDYDFIITTGGASNGDYDFIKPVVEDLGELLHDLGEHAAW